MLFRSTSCDTWWTTAFERCRKWSWADRRRTTCWPSRLTSKIISSGKCMPFCTNFYHFFTLFILFGTYGFLPRVTLAILEYWLLTFSHHHSRPSTHKRVSNKFCFKWCDSACWTWNVIRLIVKWPLATPTGDHREGWDSWSPIWATTTRTFGVFCGLLKWLPSISATRTCSRTGKI